MLICAGECRHGEGEIGGGERDQAVALESLPKREDRASRVEFVELYLYSYPYTVGEKDFDDIEVKRLGYIAM